MPEKDIVAAVAGAKSWDARVAVIRNVPEEFGLAKQPDIYAAIAERVYVPNLAPDFAYIHWADDYEVAPLEAAYREAHDATHGFADVDRDALTRTIAAHPATLRIFRLLLGFTTQEFAEATTVEAERTGLPAVGNSGGEFGLRRIAP